jgi:hypothetical protein
MKYASAMKYGGELVAAVDCDYSSFKELVPLCPNCKEPVYLRIGGQRESVKGKAYQIGPHWCHFKGISAEQVSGCELRVNGYTEQDRAKIAAQARGQRLKLLQRWFWRVFFDGFVRKYKIPKLTIDKNFAIAEKEFLSCSNDDNLLYCLLPASLGWENKSEFAQVVAKEFEKEWVADFSEIHDGAKLNAVLKFPCIPELLYFVREYGKNNPETVKNHYERYIENGNAVPNGADEILHRRIALEVHAFLLSPKQNSTLAAVIALFLTMASCNLSVGGWLSKQICDDYNPSDVVTSALAMSILSIPWASEFQRLEAEAKQRKDAA